MRRVFFLVAGVLVASVTAQIEAQEMAVFEPVQAIDTTMVQPYAPVIVTPAPVQTYYSAPVQTSGQYYRAPQQRRPFEKLIELERRKNDWLRRTFLGR